MVLWKQLVSIAKKKPHRKIPNGFGLYDMHGNVQEWTEDISAVFLPSGVDPWSGHVWECQPPLTLFEVVTTAHTVIRWLSSP